MTSALVELIQDAPLGQTIRYFTGNRWLQYPEEKPDFEIPWEKAALDAPTEKEIEVTPARSLASTTTPRDNYVSDEEALRTIPTAVSTRSRNAMPLATRTKTREATIQYSRDRFAVEQEEAVERERSAIIQPTITSDGVTLIDWYTTDDPANPQNWKTSKKIIVSAIIALYTFVVYSSSAIYTPAVGDVMRLMGVGPVKASLGLSMYVIGYGLGPILFSPISEVPIIGRNPPYIITFALFTILAVPSALINSFASLLVLRILTGFLGSPALATGGATMGDIYGLLKLPYGLVVWTAAAFAAPALGPTLSGFAIMNKSWHWAFWEILWMAAPTLIIMYAFLPETSGPNILLRRAQRLRKLTGRTNLKAQSEIDQGTASLGHTIVESLWKPWEISIKDPAVLFTHVYTAFIYGVYYSFFEAFPLSYGPGPNTYGFNLGESGLPFLSIVVGAVIGIAIYVSYVYFYLEPDIKAHGLRAQEHRLVPALFAVFLLPAGMFWFGWTVNPGKIHWIVSIIGLTLFPIGAFVLMQSIFMYLPLTYPQYAASLFAANDAARSMLATGSIVYAHPLYVNLGIGRGTSVLAGLMCGGIVGVWALYFYGAKLRAKSKFAQS